MRRVDHVRRLVFGCSRRWHIGTIVIIIITIDIIMYGFLVTFLSCRTHTLVGHCVRHNVIHTRRVDFVQNDSKGVFSAYVYNNKYARLTPSSSTGFRRRYQKHIILSFHTVAGGV